MSNSKRRPVIGIGLDSADPELIERWIAAGHLPNLAALREQGAYGRLDCSVDYLGREAEFTNTEPLWVMFCTGCMPDKTGFWDTAEFDGQNYKLLCDQLYSGYDYEEYKPFYALGDAYKVGVFDVPVARLVDGVNGFQSLGWGGHFPFVVSGSRPAEFLPDIIKQYGENPLYLKEGGMWWDPQYRDRIRRGIQVSTARRSEICRDLLKRDAWDLFLTTFGDTHSAGHEFWDSSQPDHPLYADRKKADKGIDHMLESHQDVDRAVGEIIAAAPDDAYILCYSVHGMAANVTDLLSMMMLPELLYRINFPGKAALASGRTDKAPGKAIRRPIRNAWATEVWRKLDEPNPLMRLFRTWAPKSMLKSPRHGLESPYHLEEVEKGAADHVDLDWMPATWYHKLWPRMRAFALPAFADGQIRINLKGREPQGIVSLDEYDALCDELIDAISQLKDGRSGENIVDKVFRTRVDPAADDSKLPHADLVVQWKYIPTDVVDSPKYGRIGPVTFNRPGSHRPQGFCMVKGQGITPNSDLANGHPVDLGPTMLYLLGADIPDHFDGKPLFQLAPSGADDNADEPARVESNA